MFKNMRLVTLFDILLNPSFKMTTLSPIYLELQLAQVNLYTKKDFKSLGIGSNVKMFFPKLCAKF